MRALTLTLLVAASLCAAACSVRPLETPQPLAPAPDGGGQVSSAPAPCSALAEAACRERSDCAPYYTSSLASSGLVCATVSFLACDQGPANCTGSAICPWDHCCPEGMSLVFGAECSTRCAPTDHCIWAE